MEEFTDKPTEKFIFETTDLQIAKMYVKSVDMVMALGDIKDYLRTETKYFEEGKGLDFKTLDEVRTKFIEILNGYQLFEIIE